MVWDWEGASIPRHQVVHQHGAHLALNGAHCGALCCEALCRLLDRLLSELLAVTLIDDLRQLVPDQVVDDALLARVNLLPTHGTRTASETCTNRNWDGVATNQCFVEQSCARSVSHSPDAIEMPSPRGVGTWTASVVLCLLQSPSMSFLSW